MRTILILLLVASLCSCTTTEIETTGSITGAAIKAVVGSDKAKIARVAKVVGDIQKASAELATLTAATRSTLK